jgi:hypothetical protein
MPQNLRQNVVIFTVVLSFFALSFAAGATSAQTSKKPAAKPTPAPGNKNAKATSTTAKKEQAKAAPTPKKSAAATAKPKTGDKKPADKKTAAKTADKKPTAKAAEQNKSAAKKDTAKNRATAKTKEAASKTTAAAKSNQKTPAQKPAAATASKSAGRNSKTAAAPKNVPVANKTAPKQQPARETASKPAARPPVRTPERISGETPQIIVTDISARIRSQATPNAPEVTQARLGSILQVTEKTPAWYRVQFSSGAKTSSGWISANSVNDLNSAGRDQIYRQIADRYYRDEGMDFGTASELYDFLTRAAGDLGNSNSTEIEFKRLLALRSALKNVPPGSSEQNPYRDFLKANEESVVYSEPAGEWLVVSNLFWDLRKKYEKSPLAEEIAWEAAQNPLPGECEGYVNCYLFYLRMTTGEYLSLHPNGKRNLQALTDLTNSLEPIAASLPDNTMYTGPSDVTDRAEFNSLIAELRTIISRLPLTEKERPLQQLKKIAEGFR